NIGLPNAMTQMVNSWKDQIPIRVAVASVEQDALGRDLFQESDHCEVMTQPITKWYWAAKTTSSIPETVRRGMKFASTSPCGPVFLSLPTNTLREEATAAIWDQAKFDVPMRIRPDKDDIAKPRSAPPAPAPTARRCGSSARPSRAKTRSARP